MRVLFALVLVCLAAACPSAEAGDITYDLLAFSGYGWTTDNEGNYGGYFDDQRGVYLYYTPVTLSGTIVTDGALGNITPADIVSWNWSVGPTAANSGESGATLETAKLFATSSTLSLQPGGSLDLDWSVQLLPPTGPTNWSDFDVSSGFNMLFSYHGGNAYGPQGSGNWSVQPSAAGVLPVAGVNGVPEPATIALAASAFVFAWLVCPRRQTNG